MANVARFAPWNSSHAAPGAGKLRDPPRHLHGTPAERRYILSPTGYMARPPRNGNGSVMALSGERKQETALASLLALAEGDKASLGNSGDWALLADQAISRIVS